MRGSNENSRTLGDASDKTAPVLETGEGPSAALASPPIATRSDIRRQIPAGIGLRWRVGHRGFPGHERWLGRPRHVRALPDDHSERAPSCPGSPLSAVSCHAFPPPREGPSTSPIIWLRTRTYPSRWATTSWLRPRTLTVMTCSLSGTGMMPSRGSFWRLWPRDAL